MFDVKRCHYFNHQFLNEKDFQDEQSYHIFMRRLHNKSLHKWGVVEGLTIEKKGDREIVVRPGFAIDMEGREIILAAHVEREIGEGSSEHAFVTIVYKESYREEDRQNASEAESYRRTKELPEVHVRRELPADQDAALILGRVHLDGSGKIRDIDLFGRQTAGFAIGPRAIGTEELADYSVTGVKLAPGSVTEDALAQNLRGSFGARGWVRLTFKPLRLPPLRRREGGGVVKVVEDGEEFVSDEAYASCGSNGARGSMSIPTPPGATHVKAFRLAGNTSGSVAARLIRTGWNAESNRGEETELLNEIMNETAFNRHFPLPEHHRHLDPQLHSLVLSVRAEKESKIWLVAVEFE